MKWIKSQTPRTATQVVAVAALLLGGWGVMDVAEANAGAVYEEPSHHHAPATLSAPGANHQLAMAATRDTPLMLAQAQTDAEQGGDAAADDKDAKDDEAKEAEGPPPSRFWVVNTLRANPMLAIFLTLAVGYWVGAVKLGNFSLGAVTGVLLVGIVVGQLDITISPQVKTMFFLLFLFAVGYGVGPQFVRGIAKDGGPQALFAVVICVLCLVCVYIAALVAGYGPGFAAGLLAGAQTISASIGLATDAINGLGGDVACSTACATGWCRASATGDARSR